MRAREVTEDNIKQLVDSFYAKVRGNDVLGPIFNGEIGDRWDEHLPKMYGFWSSMILKTGKYDGRPMPAHVKLVPKGVVKQDDFDVWLDLFCETVDEIFDPSVGNEFKKNGINIAQSLQLGMFGLAEKPNYIRTTSRPVTAKVEAWKPEDN